MSKHVKNLITNDLRQRLVGVEDAVLVDVVGMDANKSMALRRQLRKKDIHLMVVKNSLARLATEGTRLGPAFEGAEGTLAVMWGGEDFVSLVKEVAKLDGEAEYEKFKARGGVLDGERLSAERVKEISKWPSRVEQLSILSGQILSPGSRLVSQLTAPAGALASQVEQKSKGDGTEGSTTEGNTEIQADGQGPDQTEPGEQAAG